MHREIMNKGQAIVKLLIHVEIQYRESTRKDKDACPGLCSSSTTTPSAIRKHRHLSSKRNPTSKAEPSTLFPRHLPRT